MIRPFVTFLKTYPRVFGCILIAICFILDFTTKQIILHQVMSPPTVIPVTSFFNLVLAWNTGVSFSLFDSYGNMGTLILTITSGMITLFFFAWMVMSKRLWTTSALAMIIGGALGNLYDRVTYGAVVDFLDFYIGSYHWPAFNLADTFITIGVIFILLDSFFDRKGDQNA